jgi:precorrin-2 dehydrogenase / sirohydrochlorin ferrochelatase
VGERAFGMSYPVMLNLTGRLCVVVGAGKVAQRKIVGLLDAGASVRVVGNEPTPQIQDLADKKRIVHYLRGFLASDLAGAWMAFAATNDPDVNEAVHVAANVEGILFCHTAGGEGDLTLPAVFKQDDLTVAVSTGGSSPLYARIIRDALEEYFADGHGEILKLLRETRAHLKDKVGDSAERQEIWRLVLDKDIFDAVQTGDLDHVKKRIRQCL